MRDLLADQVFRTSGFCADAGLVDRRRVHVYRHDEAVPESR
jgi:hypothetical protein